MGAYINALREEGTRADLLREIERLLDERSDLLKAACYAAKILRQYEMSVPYGREAIEKLDAAIDKTEIR